MQMTGGMSRGLEDVRTFWIGERQSVPGFLAQVTTEMFEKTTVSLFFTDEVGEGAYGRWVEVLDMSVWSDCLLDQATGTGRARYNVAMTIDPTWTNRRSIGRNVMILNNDYLSMYE
jgi:hypothetical protein